VTLLPTKPPTPQPSASATPPPTATPIPEKPVRVALQSNPENLHPFYAQSPAAQTVLGALFVGCVGPNEKGEPIALGCEQVPTLENGGAKFVGEGLDRYLEVTFKIRLGWRWTDGQAVTANDAVYAWQLLMQPEANLRDPLTQKVFAMSAPDPRTIVVNFMSAAQARAAANGELTGDVAFQYFSQLGDYVQNAQQETPLLDANYWGVVRWLPAHVLQGIAPKDHAASPYAQLPIGDGAFEIKSRPNTGIVLARAAQAFPLGEVKPVGIEFVFGDDLSKLDYNLSWAMPYDEYNQLAQTIEFDASSTEQLLLNVDRFPFNNVKVRQAVAYALNREVFWKEVMPVLPMSPLTPTLGYVPQRALELLTEAGWNCTRKPCQKFDETKGVTQTLEFTLVTTERTPRNLVAQVIQKQLGDIGFGVNIQIVYGLGTQSKLFAAANEGGILLSRNFDAALYQAPETNSLRGRFDCASVPSEQASDTSKGNASGFCDAEIDALIAASEVSEDVLSPASRAKAYAEALAAVEAQAPVVRLYIPKLHVLAEDLSGLKPGANVPVTWNAWEWVLTEK
jgi:ABC-type transport system substrate-binding protein